MSADALPYGARVVSRAQWGAAAPTGSMKAQPHPPTEAFIHWTGSSALYVKTAAQQAARMRAYQRYHQIDNGWSDLGYHYVVFQPTAKAAPGAAEHLPSGLGTRPHGTRALEGAIFAGRLASKVPAAQMAHNAGTLAICVDAGPGDPIKRRTLYLIETLINAFPSIERVGGHSDVVRTGCPGDELYGWVDRIAAATGRKRYPRAAR